MLSNHKLALTGLALTNLFWAGNAVVARFVVDDIPPLTLAFGRWMIAFLVLFPFAIPHLRGQWRYLRRQWLVILVLGLMGVSVYNTVLYLAAHSTVAVNITLVSSTLPLITLLASWLLLSLRPSYWQLLGIIISLCGVLTIISSGDMERLLSLAFNRGDVMIFGIACCWSVYSVLLRKYPIHLHPLALLFVLVVAGLPFLFLLFLFEVSVAPAFSLSQQSWVLMTYTALFPSVLAYLFWGFGVREVGPNIAALSCYLMPLFAAILAVSLLGERLYWYHFLGGAFILCGLYFASVMTSFVKAEE